MVIGYFASRDGPPIVGVGVASPRLWEPAGKDRSFDTTFPTEMLMMCELTMQLEITLAKKSRSPPRFLEASPKPPSRLRSIQALFE